MKIQGYELDDVSGENVCIRDSAGAEINSNDPAAILDFLLTPYPGTLKAVWDLDVFFAPVLKLLGFEVCRKIDRTHKATCGPEGSVEYEIYYIPDKMLSITKSPGRNLPKLKATYYGLCGFFDDDTPEPASALSLKELGDQLLTELEEIGIKPTQLVSPIGAFMTCDKLPRLSTIADTPDEFMGAQLYAEECTGKEWREALKVGHWGSGGCYSYDITCAYGAVAARLLDLANAGYTFSDKMITTADWGFLRGTVTINDDVKISPIMTRIGDGRLINPIGTFDTYLTLDEALFIERWGIGTFTLRDGWFVRFKNRVTPLQGLMEELYSHRRHYPLLNNFLKRVPSGIAGKFHEHYIESGPGELFNPIYHAIITSSVRLQVARLIYESDAQNSVIRINTDGLLCDKPLWIARGAGIGRWRQVESQDTIVLSPELVFQGAKHPNGMTYPRLCSLICRHLKSSLYQDKTIKKRITLFEAIRDDDLPSLGKMTTRTARVDLTLLGQSQIRNFSRFPRTGEQLIENKYTSTPIRLGKNSRRTF
jgi:hypothetical protein